MRKTGKRFGRLVGAAMAAALAMQTAFVPVMAADSTAEVPDLSSEVQVLESMLPTGSALTSEISLSGAVNGVDISADLIAVTDAEKAASSLSGAVNAAGTDISFDAYMDAGKVELKLPDLPVLSYDYTADPSGSLLAQLFGEETLKAMNKVLQLVNSGYMGGNPEGMQKLAEQLNQIYAEAMNQVKFEAAPSKDCTLGGEKVSCVGMQTTITGQFIADILGKMLDCTLPNGQTYREYFDMVLSLSNTGASPASGSLPKNADAFIEQYAAMPEVTFAMYTTAEGTPAEFDLTAQGSTLAVELRGAAATPWTEIAVVVDGKENAVLYVEPTETGFELSLVAAGSEMGYLVIDMQDMTFELNSTMLPSPVVGSFAFDGESFSAYVSYDELECSLSFAQGGVVAEPEGDEVIDLTKITEEEFNTVFSQLSGLFSAVMPQANADAA